MCEIVVQYHSSRKGSTLGWKMVIKMVPFYYILCSFFFSIVVLKKRICYVVRNKFGGKLGRRQQQ